MRLAHSVEDSAKPLQFRGQRQEYPNIFGEVNKEKFTLKVECICHFADDIAEFGWGEAVETLAVGYDAYAAHLYSTWREKNTFILRRKETLRARFAAEEDDGVEFRR